MEADFVCEVCHDCLESSMGLSRHMKDVHLIEASYSCVCDICQRVFGSKRCLSKHKKNVHFVTTFCRANRPEAAFLCSRCGERVSPDELEDHETSHALDDEAEEEEDGWRWFGCPACGVKFTNRSNMRRHLAKAHELVAARDNAEVGCPLCEDKLRRNLLDGHVRDAHGVEIDTDVLIFYSKQDFFQWKAAMEAQTLSSFVTRSSSSTKALFVCHRTGHSSGQRRRGVASAKTGRWCPARITARYGGGAVWARFCKTHLGHGRSARFLRLSKAERAALAGRIRRGEALGAILDDVRASAPEGSRLGALSKRDLHNIVRDFGLHSLQNRGAASPTCMTGADLGAVHPSVEDHSYCVSEAWA